jgi:hypothetical protein
MALTNLFIYFEARSCGCEEGNRVCCGGDMDE